MEDHGMERLLHRLGYAMEWMRDEVRGAARFADEPVTNVRETLGELVDELGDAGDGGVPGLARAALPMAATAIGGWLAGRVLQPRRVHVPRAVLAGLIGTVVYDLVTRLDDQLSGRRFDTVRPLGEAITGNEELQGVAGWTAHYAAGIGLAIVYARFVYGRLPAPGIVQGAAFGAADAVTVQWGGVLPLLSRLVPDAKLPGGYAGLAANPELSARSLARHLAFGAALGTVYRS
jgi:hypothetical protein